MKRIGILTGGGDAPGLNAVIRAVVKSAHNAGGYEILGIRNGYDGLLELEGIIELTRAEVRGIVPKGDAILGTASRGNPFARKVVRDGEEVIEDVSDKVVDRIAELDLDSLIVVGGSGHLELAWSCSKKGLRLLGFRRPSTTISRARR